MDRWSELRATVWSTENLLADIDQAVSQLSDGNPRLEKPAAGEPSNPIARNFAKWGTLTSYLWPNCFFGQGDCPSSPLPGGRRPSSYGDYISIMKDFVQRRTAWMDTQFPRAPAMTPTGGVLEAGTQVMIDLPVGWSAVYTLDGSDPAPTDHGQPGSGAVARGLARSGIRAAEQSIDRSVQWFECCRIPTSCFMNPDYIPGRNGEFWITGSMGARL